MTDSPFSIIPERPRDAALIEELNAIAFGPGRFTLTAYRVREQARKIDELCFTAWSNTVCIGAIRHSLILCGEQRGLMLGPLVVHPDHKSRGCGMALIDHAMAKAEVLDYPWAILVGDEPYYSRARFKSPENGKITFPGPVDPARILVRELRSGSSQDLHGLVRPAK